MSRSPGRHFGGATAGVGGAGAGYAVLWRGRGDRLNRFLGTTHSKAASTPDGYGMAALVPPITAGSMGGVGRIALAAAGNLLSGGPMTGGGTVAITSSSSLSLIASLGGSGNLSITPSGSLSMVAAISGSGNMSLSAAAGLSLLTTMSGSAAWSLTGAGDVRMRLSMSGGWTPFEELSADGLAAAVWGATAAGNNGAGTMGERLNLASAGGVDYSALAAAVWGRILTAGVDAQALVAAMAEIHGLVPGAPLTVNATTRAAGSVTQSITEAGGTVTVTRV
ncbi:MAG: hypothetical protein L6Q68_02340 [Aquabacterium sp.]|nr:hypothetical protein [Aquabacterium sp.]